MRKRWMRPPVQGRMIARPIALTLMRSTARRPPHYARSPARCEACGLAEPDHAVSVNGRAAEPINSVGGALSRVSARQRESLEPAGGMRKRNGRKLHLLGISRRFPVDSNVGGAAGLLYPRVRTNVRQ